MERGEQTRKNFKILTTAKFQNSQHELIRISQNTSFKEEINNLKQERHVKPSSSIAPLPPLKAANIPPNSKHQILISKHHPIAKLLTTDIHLNYKHCGENIPFVSFGKIIGIPVSRGLIRKILSNCFICKRQNAKPAQTQMVNLPNIRLQSHVKPFSNTGVDYFGLIQTKTSRKTRRN